MSHIKLSFSFFKVDVSYNSLLTYIITSIFKYIEMKYSINIYYYIKSIFKYINMTILYNVYKCNLIKKGDKEISKMFKFKCKVLILLHKIICT